MHTTKIKYHSDISVFLKPIAIVFLIIAIGGCLYYGQEYWTSNHFNKQPLYDFLTNYTIIFAIIVGVFYALKMFYPITLTPNSIRCYDSAGKYHTVQWADITAAYPQSILGLKYVIVEAKGLAAPITIPLFLDDKNSFVATLRTKDKKGIIIRHFVK